MQFMIEMAPVVCVGSSPKGAMRPEDQEGVSGHVMLYSKF